VYHKLIGYQYTIFYKLASPQIAGGEYSEIHASMSQLHQNFIATVVDLYGLELDEYQVDTITFEWLKTYDRDWIVKAIVESLYRGRYKIVSVDKILKDWHRLGQPRYNFTPEYEQEILQTLPDFINLPEAAAEILPRSMPQENSSPAAPFNTNQLNPEESAPYQCHNQSKLIDQGTDSERKIIPAEQQWASSPLTLPTDGRRYDRVDLPSSSTFASPQQNDRDRDCHCQLKFDRIGLSQYGVVNACQCHGEFDSINLQLPKLQLFNTLRSIVDPNYHQELTKSDLALLSEQDKSLQAIEFQQPIEDLNEEQYS
jgi:hypothetical protein